MFLRDFKGLKEKAAKVRFAVCLLCPLRSISANASACFSLRLRTFWRAGVHAAGGTMHRVVQNPCC